MGTSSSSRIWRVACVAAFVLAACGSTAPPPQNVATGGVEGGIADAGATESGGLEAGPSGAGGDDPVDGANGAGTSAASGGGGGGGGGETEGGPDSPAAPSAGGGPQGGAATNPSFPQHGVTADQILIGSIFPLTGGFAESAEGTGPDVIQDWFDDFVNSKGGIHGRRVKFIFRDDSFDPNKGAQVAKKLVEEDKVLALVNPVTTFTLENIAGYLAEHHVSVIVPDGYQPPAYTSEWYFPTTNFFDRQGYRIGTYLVCELGYKRIGVWSIGSYASSKMGGDAIEKGVKDCGGTVVDRQDAAMWETNYTPYVVSQRATNPDAVGSAMHPLADSLMVSAAKQQGWKPEGGFMHLSASVGPTFEGLGSWADKIRAVTEFDPASAHPDHAKLQEWAAWAKAHGIDPDTRFGIQMWTGLEIFLQAAQAAGPNLNRDTLKAALDNLAPIDFGAICQPIVFGKGPHDPNPCLRVVRWDPGKKTWKTEQGLTKVKRPFQ